MAKTIEELTTVPNEAIGLPVHLRQLKDEPLTTEELDSNFMFFLLIAKALQNADIFTHELSNEAQHFSTFDIDIDPVKLAENVLDGIDMGDGLLSWLSSMVIMDNPDSGQWIVDLIKDDDKLSQLASALIGDDGFMSTILQRVESRLQNLDERTFDAIFRSAAHRLFDDPSVQPHLQYVASTPYTENDTTKFTDATSYVNKMPDGSIVYDPANQKHITRIGNEWRDFSGNVVYTVSA